MTPKTMNLKYRGKCRDCGASLPAGTRAVWHGRGRGVSCLSCDSDNAPRAVYAARPQVTTFTTSGGTFTQCQCEDRPCCGC